MATARDILRVRGMLWDEIKGRDQSDESDESEVLRIRTMICALYGMDAEAPFDKLNYFLVFWERSGLSKVELAGAILDAYGIIYRAD
jgi:hypothetical protein